MGWSDNLAKVCPHAHCFEEMDMFDAATMFRATGPTILPSLSPSKSPETSSPSKSPSLSPVTSNPTTSNPTVSPSQSPETSSPTATASSSSKSPSDTSASLTIQVVNLALEVDAVASQSTTCYGGVASRAIDGNTNGAWTGGSVQQTCGNDPSSWWMVDLGADKLHMITSVSIHSRTDCCRDMNAYSDIQVLDHSGNVVATQTIAAGDVQSLYNFDFGNAQGRYVRIQKKSSGAINIAEVEVMGFVDTSPTPVMAVTTSPVISSPETIRKVRVQLTKKNTCT